jgi:Uma2 family endonuclease
MGITSDLRLTNADLEAMPEDGNRYEVIDGELFVSGPPTLNHQRILVEIVVAFGAICATIRSERSFPEWESYSTNTMA